MLLSMANSLSMRDEKCSCYRECSLPMCQFLSNQSLWLRWVTQSISWFVPYTGSLRRAHSVSASGAGSVVLSFSASCCWTVDALSFETPSFYRGFALHLYIGCTLRHIWFLIILLSDQQSVQRMASVFLTSWKSRCLFMM